MATSSDVMRAIDIKGGKGPADALFVNRSTPKPKPSGSEVLVKIKAFGLNRMDLLQREGNYPVPAQAPSTLGVEFSGTIEALGSSTSDNSSSSSSSSSSSARPEPGFKVGDAVFGLAYGGAYAEYIAVSTHMLIHKPAELSWEKAAGIPETWITATQALHLVGGFEAGRTVLWHAGASSVSIAGIQLSREAGAAAVYATAGSDAKVAFCEGELGATKAFNYHDEDGWAGAVRKATDGERGVDLIIDFVGQSYFQSNLDLAARDGRIVQLGAMSGTRLPAGVDISAFVMKRVRFEGTTLRSRDVAYQARLRDMLVEHALPRLVDGRFKVFLDRIFRFEDIVEAHKFMESNKSMGKIIVSCTE
ncbi:MAG: hypothetical protein M1825_003866 [Sarcosagium campestre]|nr:MAG: hypothetical protein M1825_003866 [Sarcosagium campestre]